MPLLQLIVLAIVQGITEFLPISSSAHLILVPALVDGWQDQGRALDVAAHVGTLAAVVAVFWKDVRQLFIGGVDTLRWKETAERRFFWLITAASVPLLIVGLVAALTGLADAMRSPIVIAWASIGFGILLWVADRRPALHTDAPSTWRATLAIGAAQALSIIPGTSRSGITMTAARWLGYDRTEAARFSMVLAIPAILMAGGYETLALIQDGGTTTPLSAIIFVTVLSFFAALAAIVIFLKLTKTMSFTPFVIYRILLGIALLVLFSG